MGLSKVASLPVLVLALFSGCIQHHDAKVQTALLPPPSASPVQHTGRLWVELGDATWEHQCRSPKGQRQVCFAGVRKAAFGALSRSLWTSFPGVTLRDGDPIPTGDYLLKLDVTVDALPPDADGPGWSAIAAGGFRLSRDGKVLHEERLGSRSRAAFAYGGALGIGAGEVVDAVAAHVAQVLGAVAEERPFRAAPLPAVVAEVITSVGEAAPQAAAASPTETAPVPAAEAAPAPAAETAPPAADTVSSPASGAPAPVRAPVDSSAPAAPLPPAPTPSTPVAAR